MNSEPQFRVNPLTSVIPRGKKLPTHVTFEYVRDLVPTDLVRMGEEELGVQAPMLVRLKHRHHSLARALAEGLKPSEAAAVTGYAISRVSILQNDPAFAELVSFYIAQVNEKFTNAIGKRAELHESVVDELQARLDDQPEKFTNKDLTGIMQVTTPTGGGFGQSGGAMPQGIAINIRFTDPPPRDVIDVIPNK